MKLASRIDLVFPPYAKLVTFPELGMPQLTAYLKTQAVHVVQQDLNIKFLRDELLAPRQLRLIARTLRRGGDIAATVPNKGPRSRALWKLLEGGHLKPFTSGMFGMPLQDRDMMGLLVGLAETAFQLVPPRAEFTFDGILRRVGFGNPFFERFYENTLFTRWRASLPPVVIGISLGMATQVFPALLLAFLVKRRFPDVKVAMGGPWVNQAREVIGPFMAKARFVDYCCVFEGERPLDTVFRALAGSRRLPEVPGLFVREGQRLRHAPPAPPIPLDDLPPPDFSGLPLGSYQDFVLPIQTTRNCTWGRCVFCYHHVHSAATGVEMRDPKTLVRHMRSLKESTGCTHFFLADSCTPQELIGALSAEIARSGLVVRLSTMTRSTGRWTRQRSVRAAEAGVKDLFIGLECADPRELARLQKGITLEGLEHDIRNLGAAGIGVNLFVIAYPTQPPETLRRTLEWLRDHRQWIATYILQRFELGRSTAVFGNPGTFSLELPEDVERRLDVFSLPYRTSASWSEASFEKTVKLAARVFDGSGRVAAGPAEHSTRSACQPRRRGSTRALQPTGAG